MPKDINRRVKVAFMKSSSKPGCLRTYTRIRIHEIVLRFYGKTFTLLSVRGYRQGTPFALCEYRARGKFSEN